MEEPKLPSVYRYYDKYNVLLYVGMSINPIVRLLTEHTRYRGWASQIVTIKIEYFETKEKACAAEMQAIHIENPQYNIVRLTKEGSKKVFHDLVVNNQVCHCETCASSPQLFLPLVKESKRRALSILYRLLFRDRN